jgi:hypothetical protein
MTSLNVPVEWVELLLREVAGSKLLPEASYPGRLFVAFLSRSRKK